MSKMKVTAPNNPFRIALADTRAPSLLRPIAKLLERMVERAVLLDRLADDYDSLWQEDPQSSPEDFSNRCLSLFNTRWHIERGSIDAIPKEGPVLLVCNHPFGGMEGVVLIDLLSRVRKDSKVLANHILKRIDELAPRFIAVDPFETSSSAKKNIRGVGECLGWLKKGGLLATFPSGTVSHFRWSTKEISDPEWNKNIATFARRTRATVVPVYFHGNNSYFFQVMGLIHPLLRTMLIPREFYLQKGKSIEVRIGAPVSPKRIESFATDVELVDYLRLRTYLLGQEAEKSVKNLRQDSNLEPIIAAIPRTTMAGEIRELSPEQCLHEHGKFEVYCANPDQIPNTLREIGRLRELSFRAANEGTGKSLDLDVFDNLYEHLFVWDSSAQQVVGAYRIAKADRIIEKYGIRGLYTYSLFSYTPPILQQMGKALEVGRSFVSLEYQRDFNALLRLWEGIGRYVSNNPEYHSLFGPVSISSDYNAVSRQLIVDFLQLNYRAVGFTAGIRARTPMSRTRIRGVHPQHVRVVKSLTDVNELLKEVESTQNGLPVLLRQYLKLGAKVIGYNIDHDFGNVLDALIYVDLAETQPRLLERYLGPENAPRFLEMHRSNRRTQQVFNKD